MQTELLLVPAGRNWPSTVEDGIPVFRDILQRFHAALIAANASLMAEIEQEADDLACHLNGEAGRCGILAPDGPGTKLEKLTAAPLGAVPIWGQVGDFVIEVLGIPVRIEQDGIYGFGCGGYCHFAIHAVDYTLPFFSHTGYRSFYHSLAIVPNQRPDQVARIAIEHNFRTEMKSRLVHIGKEYVERDAERRAQSHAA